MSLARFQTFLRHECPAFRCYGAGDRAKTLSFTAHVSHVLRAPATNAALSQFDSQLGSGSTSLRELYSLHDGMLLFCDTQSDAAGIELFPIADWPGRTAEMQESMGFDLGDMPEWFGSGVVIGEMPQSANYLVVGAKGEIAGKMYYADHDDLTGDSIADDAESLIHSLIEDPAKFLYERGCYARYSDGRTETQWIPKEYVNATTS